MLPRQSPAAFDAMPPLQLLMLIAASCRAAFFAISRLR